MSVTVIVKCLQCGFKQEVKPGELAADDYPMCPRDGHPLVVVKAQAS